MEQCLVCGKGCDFLIADENNTTPSCSSCYNKSKLCNRAYFNKQFKNKLQEDMNSLLEENRRRQMRYIY